MKKLLSIALMVVLAQPTFAQLGKLMSKYQEQDGFTVTRLDKSLYGLYKSGSLPSEAEELLKNLDEVNILNLNVAVAPASEAEIMKTFKAVLNDDYRLVKSHKDQGMQQQVYAKTKDGKVSDLVVWNRSYARLDVIELRGDINTDNLAMLSKTLNIKGLNTLNDLAATPPVDRNRPAAAFNDPFGNQRKSAWGMPEDDMHNQMPGFLDMQQMMQQMMSDFGDSFNSMMDNMDFSMSSFASSGMGSGITSSSVQIYEENGKTKIKINAAGQEMSYIVDGQEIKGDEIALPDRIRLARVVGDPNDNRKQYLLVVSNNKLGEFVSFKGNELKFKYNDKQYSYKLDGSKPLLWINGRLSSQFQIDPASINQIRVVEDIEKNLGYFGPAEVVINTK